MLLEIEVETKAMTWSVVDLERTVNFLGTEKKLLHEEEGRAFSLLAADKYEWSSSFGQGSESYSACVLRICV